MERKLLLALCLGLATCFALGLPARAGDGEADAPGDAERMAPGDDAPAPREEAAAGDPDLVDTRRDLHLEPVS